MPEAAHTVIVRDRRLEADVAFLDLSAASGELPGFAAGAHIDVHLPGGLIRQYSLWNGPDEDKHVYRIAVRLDRQGRGGSAAAHAIAAGATLSISPPRNHFALLPAGMTVLVGAGIGITPLLSMAADLHRRGQNFRLHYIDRGKRAAFVPILEQVPFAACARFHDTAGGRPSPAALLGGCGADARLYLCGPAAFLTAFRAAGQALPVPPRGIHEESFTPAAIQADGAFTVITDRDGKRHHIPEGSSIVEVLRNAGYEIATSCEQGICGACATRVLAGTPLHQDVVLSDEEHASNTVMTPCCSRSKTPELRLDL
jgi:vanillate O-demethylase ferredoxin subunit